jgi:hypothetical protein
MTTTALQTGNGYGLVSIHINSDVDIAAAVTAGIRLAGGTRDRRQARPPAVAGRRLA